MIFFCPSWSFLHGFVLAKVYSEIMSLTFLQFHNVVKLSIWSIEPSRENGQYFKAHVQV